MSRGQQLLDGTLSGFRPEIIKLMSEAFDTHWPLIARRYQGDEATALGHIRLADAIVDVTAPNASSADDIGRMAIDLVFILERDFKGIS